MFGEPVVDSSTIALYKCNGNGKDVTGNYDLNNVNTPVYTDFRFGKGLAMSGSANYLKTTSFPKLISLGTFSIEAWVRLNNNTDKVKALIGWNKVSDTGSTAFLLQQNTAALRCYVNGGYRMTFTFQVGKIYYMVITYNHTDTFWSWYVNGALQTTHNGGNGLNQTQTEFSIGYGYNGNPNATISSVHVTQRLMKDSEIRNKYNQLKQ